MTPNELTPDLAAFIEAQTSIFLATARANGQRSDRAQRCLLSGAKRTWIKRLVMSASDPKRTFDS